MTNNHDQIVTNGGLYLYLHGNDTLPIKHFDSQVQFDSFKEKLDLPPTLVIVGNMGGITTGYVDQKYDVYISFGQSNNHAVAAPGNLSYSGSQPSE